MKLFLIPTAQLQRIVNHPDVHSELLRSVAVEVIAWRAGQMSRPPAAGEFLCGPDVKDIAQCSGCYERIIRDNTGDWKADGIAGNYTCSENSALAIHIPFIKVRK